MLEPDYVGDAGKAWDLPISDDTPHSSIVSYLLFAPYAHMAWEYYLVSGIHLRPVAGCKDAVRLYEEAEFEINISAIDPSDDPDPESPRYRTLSPPNLMYQFNGTADEVVAALVKELVVQFVNGWITPDTDYRRQQLAFIASRLAICGCPKGVVPEGWL